MTFEQDIPLSIKFKLGAKNKKGTYRLFAQIIFNRKKTLISMKMFVKDGEWDSVNGQFYKHKKSKTDRNNGLLENAKKIAQCYLDLKKSGTPVTATLIKKNFEGEVTESGTMRFADYYRIHIDELKQLPNEYGEAVIGHYEKTQTHLLKFLKIKGWQEIKLSELSNQFIERFEFYLLTTPNEQTGKPMQGITSATYIKKIFASVNAALRKQIIKTNPFAGFKIKPFKSSNKVFLTAEEVEELKNHDLDNRLSLQKVRDCFLFCCYSGLRHSDAMQLSASMIKTDAAGMHWITLKQQKTGDNVEIPLLDPAVEIYKKYEAHRKATGKVLPMLTNQKANSALKTIAGLIRLNKNISWHSSRHSMATLFLEQGVDIKAVSALMGHTSVSTTEIYSRLTRKRKADVINFLNAKNKKQNAKKAKK